MDLGVIPASATCWVERVSRIPAEIMSATVASAARMPTAAAAGTERHAASASADEAERCRLAEPEIHQDAVERRQPAPPSRRSNSIATALFSSLIRVNSGPLRPRQRSHGLRDEGA